MNVAQIGMGGIVGGIACAMLNGTVGYFSNDTNVEYLERISIAAIAGAALAALGTAIVLSNNTVFMLGSIAGCFGFVTVISARPHGWNTLTFNDGLVGLFGGAYAGITISHMVSLVSVAQVCKRGIVGGFTCAILNGTAGYFSNDTGVEYRKRILVAGVAGTALAALGTAIVLSNNTFLLVGAISTCCVGVFVISKAGFHNWNTITFNQGLIFLVSGIAFGSFFIHHTVQCVNIWRLLIL